MTNEAPDRIWIDAWGGNWSPVSGGTQEIEYIRKSAAFVEVKGGYSASAFKNVDLGEGVGYSEDVPLFEALEIRTVEDVRREAISKIKKEIKDSCPNEFDEPKQKGYIKGLKTAIKLIDTPAPSRETQLCPDCGISDDGIGCGCDYGLQTQPTPSPEPAEYQHRVRSLSPTVGPWGPWQPGRAPIFRGNTYEAEERAIYLSPTHQAEELRKAKEEAWDEGFSACEDPNLDIRCNPYHSTVEGEG